MSQADREGWKIGPKSAADATGKTGVHRIAVSGVNVSQQLPSGWDTSRNQLGKLGTGPFVFIAAKGANIQYAFSNGAQTLVIDQAAALGTGHAAAGFDLANGRSERVQVPIGSTHFNVIADGAGFVSLYLAEGGF